MVNGDRATLAGGREEGVAIGVCYGGGLAQPTWGKGRGRLGTRPDVEEFGRCSLEREIRLRAGRQPERNKKGVQCVSAKRLRGRGPSLGENEEGAMRSWCMFYRGRNTLEVAGRRTSLDSNGGGGGT